MYDYDTQEILNGNNFELVLFISRFMWDVVLKLVGYARFGGTCLESSTWGSSGRWISKTH